MASYPFTFAPIGTSHSFAENLGNSCASSIDLDTELMAGQQCQLVQQGPKAFAQLGWSLPLRQSAVMYNNIQ